jgi:hypothetical protein
MGVTVCPHRYIEKGRTYCRVAILERRYCTNEVTPQACAQCHIPQVMEDHPCVHMDLGVEIDEYGGAKSIETFYASCKVTVERLMSVENCVEGGCPYFERRPATVRKTPVERGHD